MLEFGDLIWPWKCILIQSLTPSRGTELWLGPGSPSACSGPFLPAKGARPGARARSCKHSEACARHVHRASFPSLSQC